MKSFCWVYVNGLYYRRYTVIKLAVIDKAGACGAQVVLEFVTPGIFFIAATEIASLRKVLTVAALSPSYSAKLLQVSGH